MPNNIALVDSVEFPGNYELRVCVKKETFKTDLQDALVVLEGAIKAGKKIEAVYFQDYIFNIDAQDLKPLFDKIKEAKILTLGLTPSPEYGLGYCNNSYIQGIFELIKSCCVGAKDGGALEKIDLTRNGIGDANPKQQTNIVNGLLKLIPVVLELDLSLNRLGDLRGELLNELLLSCGKSNSLKVLKLDNNQLTLQRYYEKPEDGCLENFSPLFIGRNEANKWKFLSLSSTGVGFLTNVEWTEFLSKVDSCCEGISLANNSLQEQTSEGRLDVYEESDLVKIIGNWISKTTLNLLDLSQNKFSIRNMEVLENAIKGLLGKKIIIKKGNGLPNSAEYDKLLKEASDIKRLEEEEGQSIKPSPLLYMHEAVLPIQQQNPLQISMTDFQEAMLAFEQTFKQKHEIITQSIMQESFAVVLSVFKKNGINVMPASKGISDSPSNK